MPSSELAETDRLFSCVLLVVIAIQALLPGITIFLVDQLLLYTVEPPIKDTPNKGHLSIKDKSTRPNSYYTSTF